MGKKLKKVINYDREPVIVLDSETPFWSGWKTICEHIGNLVHTEKEDAIVVVELYPGAPMAEVLQAFKEEFKEGVFSTDMAMKSSAEIEEMLQDEITDDPIFGKITGHDLIDFFDEHKRAQMQEEVSQRNGLSFIVGSGASLLCEDAVLTLYVDMARWEIQQRFRSNDTSNLGAFNWKEKASLQYKRAFFVDWRVGDTHKKHLLPSAAFLIDANKKNCPVMICKRDWEAALQHAATRPFRLVPFFDPGPWGGQWMKANCGLDASVTNYAWCFDGVPEENSLLFKIGDTIFETPAMNLVLFQPIELLGAHVFQRFGTEFPIRFDLLDTMSGGNLSLQVHPTDDFIKKEFRMGYTQDESYYVLDAAPGAQVYLGLKENASVPEMEQELYLAQNGENTFEAEQYVSKWPAKKHDHFLIPAGTVHCSGKDTMVLEISATPYIFTFKLWDWDRLGLDGLPRPINIERGMQVLNTDYREGFVGLELVNAVSSIAEGDGWKEERTGLHASQFIETRRHWFTKRVAHHTNKGVNVLNLVEGEEAIVESPDHLFEPMVVHYTETFIIPAAIGAYTIRPYGASAGLQCATLKAFVRA